MKKEDWIVEKQHKMTQNRSIPGTVHLVDLQGELNVKKANTGDKDIILLPPPSNNPNDPLRWKYSKKFKQFFLLFWLAVFLAITVNWSPPIWLVWITEFNCTVNELNNAVALLFCFLGLGCLFMQPTALKLGRRFVYIICTCIVLIANIVGSQMTSVKHFYAVQILQGIGASPCDSLVQISTTDVFFQHERASYLSLFVLALYFGNYLGPTVSGYIVERLSWKWSFYLQIIMFGCILVIMLFYMEDTTFSRREDPTTVETEIVDQIYSRESAKDTSNYKLEEVSTESQQEVAVKGYWQKMKLIQTDYNDTRSWLCIWYRPFFLLALPSVIWGGIIYGAQMMWLSYMATTQATIFGSPPYSFESGKIGLTNLGPLIGNIFGMAFGGKFVDWITIKLSERNNGIMEAEFRLYAMIVPTIINAAGILAYGLGSVNQQPWPLLVVIGYGFLGFAMSSTGSICMTYAIDCYPKLAAEAMVLILFIRNMIGMVFTFTFQYWLAKCGMTLLGWLLFMMSLVLNGSFIIMIIYGKKIRTSTFDYYLKISDASFGELFK